MEQISFLIDAGYLSDENNRISQIIVSGKYGDLALPTPSNFLKALYKGETSGILNEIVNIAGDRVKSRAILLSEVDHFLSIAAVIRNSPDQFTLLFDKASVERLARNRKSNWMVALVLSHELGHIALGHLDGTKPLCFKAEPSDLLGCETKKQMELAADRFAGCVLRVLGSSFDDVKQLFDDPSFNSGDGISFPFKAERIEALLQGWKSMKGTHCDS